MTRLIQLTNPDVGAVAVNANFPLGITTLAYPMENGYGETYSITYSGADTVKVNRPGAYGVIYNASLVASEAGNVVLELIANGVSKYTVTAIATAEGTVNITLPFEIFIPCNCSSNPGNVPVYIQVKNTGVAITGGTSNLILNKE